MREPLCVASSPNLQNSNLPGANGRLCRQPTGSHKVASDPEDKIHGGLIASLDRSLVQVPLYGLLSGNNLSGSP